MPFETEQIALDSGVTVLNLSGTMTMGNQLQHFEWAVEELMKKSQKKIVVDMSKVSYVDSSAIGVLVGCNGMVKDAGGQLYLAGVIERVRAVLKMTSVDNVLTVSPSREEAISSLAAGA